MYYEVTFARVGFGTLTVKACIEQFPVSQSRLKWRVEYINTWSTEDEKIEPEHCEQFIDFRAPICDSYNNIMHRWNQI